MSLSEDEDDFLSADEGASEEDHATLPANKNGDEPDLMESDKIINSREFKESETHSKTTVKSSEVKTKPTQKKQEPSSKAKDESTLSDKSNLSAIHSVDSQPKVIGGDEDDDEEKLAERIRERNLKLARKFSAEIARTVKASAPIAVRGTPPSNRKINDIEYPNIAEADIHSSPPPAPPPTPALSSSLNSDEPSISGTQYGWRLPAKNKPGRSDEPDMKSEQTRLALDRLSEQVSQSDKNLFTKVAEDLKKVSIKSGESSNSQASSETPTMPLISDLGGTLSSWNWSNATKLLASASQVTSQVSSVLDTVSQHLQSSGQAGQRSATHSSSNEPPTARPQKVDTQEKSRSDKVSMSATEAVSNDAFVDLTLNAMESLGKKAFGVMTERDESGTLQIKGLGRPWEHLMSTKKGTDSKETSSSSYRSELYDEEPTVTTSSYSSKRVVHDEQKSSLKNRKKHSSYADDDKLD